MSLAPTLLQVVAALVVTLALVFACAFAVRRFGGIGVRGGQLIQVLSAAPIGSRERIVLLKVHDRQLLVGVTTNAITALHVFDGDVAELASDVPVAATDFKSILKRFAAKS
jgi:flagellar protein FliO/FliZ